MAFVYTSCLPKNISEQDKRDKVTSFDCDIDTIKGYLTEIANTYLLVAYRIYEMNRYRSFITKNYKNIVEACQSELGFKKSTTYNMINIVEKFGKPDTSGFISYQSLFGLEKFSYSQLCEMLSLSDRQRLQVTPDMTVKQIREIKSKELESKVVIDVKETIAEVVDDVQDPEPCAAPEEEIFQTSGMSGACYDKEYEDFDFACSECNFMFDFSGFYGDEDNYEFKDDEVSFKYCPHCGSIIVSKAVYFHDHKYDESERHTHEE